MGGGVREWLVPVLPGAGVGARWTPRSAGGRSDEPSGRQICTQGRPHG
ncbi:hypothetical protein SERN_1164 [Serinibacter arcticus]|uniref:Uncharacterized protein n=1 Tax=Serinibacter arcticus TaxID=1655435 RepID=A0A4Z1E1C4_9MICO|nr:hypothetical protein SERN_1164 [Serinibacter arcticus]